MEESKLEAAQSSLYRRNIDALSRSQPEVASAVAAAPIPDHVEPATGRDGLATFRLVVDGERLWFGRSSAPSISAVEVFSRFFSTTGVALPGVLTGREAIVVAERVPAHCAVYVLEQHPLFIKLAFHLCDYADYLNRSRIVFVLADRLAETLCAAFERRPGLGLPARLLTVPQITNAQLVDLQRRLEAAGERAAEVQRRVVAGWSAKIRERRPRRLPAAPRIAIVSDDARAITIEQAGRLGNALGRLGWPYAICVPDAPGRCHAAARLECIAQLPADLVLLVNCQPGPLAKFLPHGLPTASWYVASPSSGAGGGKAIAPGHLNFVASETLAGALAGAGVDAGTIRTCAVGADSTVFRREPTDPGEGAARPGRVGLLAELPDPRPQSYGVTVTSHLALWRAMCEAVLDGVDDGGAQSEGDWLEQAETASGVTLREPLLRERFVAWLRNVIVPAGRALVAARSLADAGLSVEIRGRNWEGWGGGGVAPGAIPQGEELRLLFHQVDAVVLPEPSALGVQTALDALACGTGAVLRHPDHPFEKEFPALAAVERYLGLYRTRAELIDRVGELMAGGPVGGGFLDRARSLVLEGHTAVQRLREIVVEVRALQAMRPPGVAPVAP